MSKFNVSTNFIPLKLDTTSVNYITEFVILHNIVGTLVLLGKDDKYYSYLAEKWDLDYKNNTILFQINKNLKFSNGKKITAHDIEFSFKRLIIKGATHLSLKNNLVGCEKIKKISDSCSGIRVVDDTKIVFKFQKLTNASLYIFTFPDSGIISKDQVDNKLDIINWKVTSGAYYIKDKQPQKLELELNPNFVLINEKNITEISLIEEVSESEEAKKLVEGKVHYTFRRYYNTSYPYKLIMNSRTVDIISQEINGSYILIFSKRHYPFNSSELRRAVVKKFFDMKFDFRPVKDDKLFILTEQILSPNSPGHIEKKEFDQIFLNSKIEKKFDDKFSFEWVYGDFMLDEKLKKQLLAFFQDIGVNIKVVKYENQEQWGNYASKTPFILSPSFNNEKEFQQALEYMISHGWLVSENVDKLKNINQDLIKNTNTNIKYKLVKEAHRLLIEDSVYIPLYHIVSQTIINKRYEVINENRFTTTPKLWNLRKK